MERMLKKNMEPKNQIIQRKIINGIELICKDIDSEGEQVVEVHLQNLLMIAYYQISKMSQNPLNTSSTSNSGWEKTVLTFQDMQ